MLEGVEESQSHLASLREKLTTQDILDAARDGDVLATRMMQRYHEHVACGLVSLCHTLDPDVFVITGGMSKFVDFDMLRDMVADRTLPRVSERLEIHPSILAEGGGMVGAAELVLAAVLSNEQTVAR
jgi:glucokinase